MADLDNFLDIARELFTADTADTTDAADATLIEHTRRVLRTCEAIVALPELAGRRIDRHCLFVAAIFHETGAAGHPIGSDEETVRRRSADLLAAHAGQMLSARQVARCQKIIRESLSRSATVIEAQVLSDAVSLEDIGALGAWSELRRFAASGRSVSESLISWQRKIEYNYWEARIKDCLRFDSVRRIAAKRLETAVAFMAQLKREHFAEDIKQLLDESNQGT